MTSLDGRRVLLVIGGGIAAYKVLELIRRLRERGAAVRAVMTRSARHFVTPLAVAALTGERVPDDLFDPADEHEIGHIRLAREPDLIVVAPATADLLARMAAGLADDLATAVLLATNKPVLVAPAMNPHMWAHAATRRNVAQLQADGVLFVGPETGEMAEPGEAGLGRLARPAAILGAIEGQLADGSRNASGHGPLAGLRAIVTSGPTHEPIDPVRFIGNRSSGRQGHAIAAALARAGAAVTLVTGPVEIASPPGVSVVPVETARAMQAAVEAALPADVAVLAAAVADWRVAEQEPAKIKKDGGDPPVLRLVENPDILAGLSHGPLRPRLVVGFAAETENLLANALAKLQRKGCDWILANDVSAGTGVFGGARNRVHLVSRDGVEAWPDLSKTEVAERLAARIAAEFAGLPQGGESAPPERSAAAAAPSPPDASEQQPGMAEEPPLSPPAAQAVPEPLPLSGAALDIRPTR